MHAVVARSTFRSQNVQNTPCLDHFGSCDVEQVHAVVARSTFRSQNVPLLEVDVEKAHAVVAEAHFEVKMLKAHQVRTTFGR